MTKTGTLSVLVCSFSFLGAVVFKRIWCFVLLDLLLVVGVSLKQNFPSFSFLFDSNLFFSFLLYFSLSLSLASLARHIYLRGGTGVGAFRKVSFLFFSFLSFFFPFHFVGFPSLSSPLFLCLDSYFLGFFSVSHPFSLAGVRPCFQERYLPFSLREGQRWFDPSHFATVGEGQGCREGTQGVSDFFFFFFVM